ncbi:MAG: sigma-70 family RNA polymerase sigma factor [Planctomycetota bacterium]
MDRDKVIRQLLDERLAVMAYINAIVRDRHHAEDLFQDLSVEAIEKAETIEDAEHLTRWLRTAGRFRAIDHLRKQGGKAMVFEPDLLDKIDLVWHAAEGQSTGDRVDALRICMTRMPGKTRELLRQRYEAGKSGVQIATDTGRSTNAIYLALSRAHQALRDCIEQRIAGLNAAKKGGDPS